MEVPLEYVALTVPKQAWNARGPVLLLGAAMLILFLGTKALTHTEAEDSTHHIRQVATGDVRTLFHPHHLLYNSANSLTYRFWCGLGYGGNAEHPMQVNNALAGAVTACLLVLTMRRLSFSLLASLLAACGLVGSYGFWWYSVEAETYILPLPFIWLALQRLILLAQRPGRPRDFIWLGVFVSLATLFHQQHVFLVFVAGLVVLVLGWRSTPPPDGWSIARGLLVYALVCAVLILGPYLLVARMVFGLSGLREIVLWSMGYAREGLWTDWAWSNLLKSCVGAGRAIWGLQFMFGFEWFSGLMQRLFPAKILEEEVFLAAHLSRARIWFCLITFLISAAGLSGLFLSGWLHRRERQSGSPGESASRAYMTVALFAVVMWLVYAVFNTLWEPQNLEFWIAPLTLIWLFAFGRPGQRAVSVRRGVWAVAAVVALFSCNLMGSVLPQLDIRADYWYAANEPLIRAAGPDDVIITEGGYISSGYLRLHTPARIVSPAGCSAAELNNLLSAARGRVYVSSWLIEPPRGVRSQLRYRDDPAVRSWFESVRPSLELFAETPMQRIYRVRAE